MERIPKALVCHILLNSKKCSDAVHLENPNICILCSTKEDVHHFLLLDTVGIVDEVSICHCCAARVSGRLAEVLKNEE